MLKDLLGSFLIFDFFYIYIHCRKSNIYFQTLTYQDLKLKQNTKHVSVVH